MKFNLETCKLEVSKHFALKYMKRWGWDFTDLRDALTCAYKIEKVGKRKYEAYARKGGQKKMIFVYYSGFDVIFVISGSEGG